MLHHPSEIPSPPLLLPSTTHRDDLSEEDMPLRKRARFTALTDASIRAAESRAMNAVGEVNERVIDLATTPRHETHKLQVWAHSESRSQAMEAQIRALQRDVDVLQRQRIRDEDRLTSHIQHEHDRFRELVCTAEEGPQDRLANASSSC
ncbi:hypothetical protein Tco_0928521 [Tanacetum coccineum]